VNVSKVINFRIPEDLLKKLEVVSKETDRNKSYIIRKALEYYLNEYMDYLIAVNRLKDKNDEIISYEEMRKRVEKV